MDTVFQRKAHHGRSVKFLREILRIKQEAIADKLDVTQSYVLVVEKLAGK